MERLNGERLVDPSRNKSFVMIKPLGVQEPYRAEILRRIGEIAHIDVIKPYKMTQDDATKLYGPSGHQKDGTPLGHFHAIVNYLTGKYVELLVISSCKSTDELVDEIDDLIGVWQPENTRPDQIRHLLIEKGEQYIMEIDTPEGSNKYVYDNLVHSSDSSVSAQRELAIFFREDELNSL